MKPKKLTEKITSLRFPCDNIPKFQQQQATIDKLASIEHVTDGYYALIWHPSTAHYILSHQLSNNNGYCVV